MKITNRVVSILALKLACLPVLVQGIRGLAHPEETGIRSRRLMSKVIEHVEEYGADSEEEISQTFATSKSKNGVVVKHASYGSKSSRIPKAMGLKQVPTKKVTPPPTTPPMKAPTAPTAPAKKMTHPATAPAKAPKGSKADKEKGGYGMKSGGESGSSPGKEKGSKAPGSGKPKAPKGAKKSDGEGTPTASDPTLAPTMVQTTVASEPKDGRNNGGDDTTGDGGDSVGNGDEIDTDTVPQESEEESDGDSGPDFGKIFLHSRSPLSKMHTNIFSVLPDLSGGAVPDFAPEPDEESKLMNVVVPVGSALAVLTLFGVFFFARRDKRERSLEDMDEFEAKIQLAEEGTLDGATDMSDFRTVTFSEDGIKQCRKMVLGGRSDKSSTVEENLDKALESLEEFEEVSLHDSSSNDPSVDVASPPSQPSPKSSSRSNRPGVDVFRMLPLGLRPAYQAEDITRDISKDDSSTSEIYVGKDDESIDSDSEEGSEFYELEIDENEDEKEPTTEEETKEEVIAPVVAPEEAADNQPILAEDVPVETETIDSSLLAQSTEESQPPEMKDDAAKTEKPAHERNTLRSPTPEVAPEEKQVPEFMRKFQQMGLKKAED
jgi:hypothetical protein